MRNLLRIVCAVPFVVLLVIAIVVTSPLWLFELLIDLLSTLLNFVLCGRWEWQNL